MNHKEINELLKEWRHRISFVRAEILADLRDTPKPNDSTKKECHDSKDVSEDAAEQTLDEKEEHLHETRERQEENEKRIAEIERILIVEGIDPFNAAIRCFLFVDTESSNCFDDVYKMCEYGHLMTDVSFRELGQKDILINPGNDGKFNLTGRKGHRDLILAHPHTAYKRQPRFDEFHNDIAFYLQQETAMVFLWASDNDIQVLLDQCARYQMTPISFVSYDVQQIFMREFPEYKGVPSLEKAATFLGLDIEGIAQHRPDEDSRITAMVLKAIVEKTGKCVLELIHNCPACQYESTRTYVSMKRRHHENMERRIATNRRKIELAPFHTKLNELLSAPVPDGMSRERLFSVSIEMKRHVEQTLPLIQQWMSRGFFLKRNLQVGYLVAYDEEERAHLNEILDTASLRIVLIDEFEDITFPKA